MKPWLILLAGLIATTVQADGEDDLYENQCHDPTAWQQIKVLLQKFPNDHLVIRAYAMRVGICRLIDEGKISLENGIQVFDIERQRAIMERAMENAGRKPPKPLPDEAIEPLS